MQKKSSPRKGPANNFSKFSQKKSNAAIKEQFKQEKRKWKKEREEYFDKKRSEKAEAASGKPGTPNHLPDTRIQSSGLMPLNKFIAHAGICARRDAAEMVKKGLVKVNGELVTEPGHKVSAKDDIK